MQKLFAILFITCIFTYSCNSPSLGIFNKKSASERYAEKVENRYQKTPEGRQWLAASRSAVEHPYLVQVPYKQHGSFHADKPRAMGLQFHAKRGEQLKFSIDKSSEAAFILFADIYKLDASGQSLVFTADTANASFTFNVDEEADFVLKLQPELFMSGNYSLSVAVGPSLAYPVSGSMAKAGSFWGAARDGGKRNHEGIDIFAPKGTPVVAASDGMITAVRDGGIGGKTIWLRPAGRNISLYYAHLDEQLIQPGASVKAGDTIGTVGNTGNAQTTQPHLHFGVYGYGGATDPLPFINKIVKQAAAVQKKKIEKHLQLTKAHKTLNGLPLKANTILVPLAVDAKGYIAELPDGQLVQTPFNIVKQVEIGTVSASPLNANAGTE